MKILSLSLIFLTFLTLVGCRSESSISKLEEQLEIEREKREEESKKYVEVLNRLSEEMKRTGEQERLIAELRHELANKAVGVPLADTQHGQAQDMPLHQDPQVETQNLASLTDKLTQLANRFYWDGDYAVAKEIYDVVAELGNPDVDTLFRLAKCYGVTPETDKAISLYQKVITSLEHNDASNPLHHQAYNNLGGMYKKKGMYKEAELAYVKAIELNEEYTNAYYNLGLLYEENLDDELGAIRCYERYVELDGERSDYIKKKLNEIKAKDD